MIIDDKKYIRLAKASQFLTVLMALGLLMVDRVISLEIMIFVVGFTIGFIVVVTLLRFMIIEEIGQETKKRSDQLRKELLNLVENKK